MRQLSHDDSPCTHTETGTKRSRLTTTHFFSGFCFERQHIFATQHWVTWYLLCSTQAGCCLAQNSRPQPQLELQAYATTSILGTFFGVQGSKDKTFRWSQTKPKCFYSPKAFYHHTQDLATIHLSNYQCMPLSCFLDPTCKKATATYLLSSLLSEETTRKKEKVLQKCLSIPKQRKSNSRRNNP